MTFSLPTDNPTNWVDDIGMIEDAAFLNKLGAMDNALKAALLVLVNGAVTAAVATNETRTASSYGTLTTTTDQVTVTIGASGKALVIVSAYMQGTAVSQKMFMGYDVSGATTRAADDAKALIHATAVGAGQSASRMFLETGLSTGSTTFQAKYKSDGTNLANFQYRNVLVIPFP